MNKLNIGCGTTFHPSWVNIDLEPSSPLVLHYDVRKGLPFNDETFDVCYSSHVLEHMSHAQAETFVKEIYRVIKPGGIVRIAVPDLEGIVRSYLSALESVLHSHGEHEADYDWMMLELYDQTVRSVSGGDMGRYLRNPVLSNKEFVVSRIGKEAEKYWVQNYEGRRKSFLAKILSAKFFSILKWTRFFIAKNVAAIIGGKDIKKYMEEGRFRNSGEIHQWMYDRFSLGRLLVSCGFADGVVCRAGESRIPNFDADHLEVMNGEVRKPDSLFMESFKH